VTVDARFCPRCGAPLPGRPPTRCEECGYALYVNARPTATVVILDASGQRFLALRRAVEPKAGLWELPGGFCDGWEHPSAAAVREAREELGVEVVVHGLVAMYVGGYEFQGETLPVLDTFWRASIVAGEIRLSPESSEYAWLPLDGTPPLAFETMDSVIRDVRARTGTNV
jgi:ADP-ribose pyrophosphatase YjhB (NUDIX family)